MNTLYEKAVELLVSGIQDNALKEKRKKKVRT